ncbi:hypothetical protein ACLI1A_17350 [Flavobacterium sp. RHBU_3]|uniref:hypothetical protein n=1 Tax=Flavobacterium sp. RHBU_3 TaxID=3391184 RepID=UPI00398519BB
MKKILLLFLMLPVMTFAQNTLAGKTYCTKTTESCKETISGGCMVYTHTTARLSKDSITFTHFVKRSDREQPETYKNTYKYKINQGSIFIDTPFFGRYILGDKVLISDCKYNKGTTYYEVTL